MELKKYQQAVLDDLEQYINELDKQPTIKAAFRSFWANKGVSIDTVDDTLLRPYNDEITGVPNVTIKVPTAGGKTYLACRALKYIFKIYPENKPKVVVWFVPSDPILKQTYVNLNNPSHPYRRAIDIDFGSKVQVVKKEEALVGDKIHPTEIKENLTIFVLSVQSFASNDADARKAKRENGYLADHVSTYSYSDKMIHNADETSLLQVIAQLNPVMIIDESHNFENSDLRVELKKDINPGFIFNLTATPRPKSNIISFVDAMQLKLEHMVKLPVIVYNHKSTTEVIANAVTLQRSLEVKALKQQKEFGGNYIRPIVLLQAQPKNSDENITFDKIKAKLIDAGIPEEQIKIKTAVKDEIKNIDLMSESCPIRFIITVNALNEGWDCPFAYILASLANKTSKVQVEQILGRILRLPYARQQKFDLLNLSYVFTCSADFQSTLKSIVDSLNKSGFSKRDYRLADKGQEVNMPEPSSNDDFGLFSQSNQIINETTTFENQNVQPVSESQSTEGATTDVRESEDDLEIETEVIKQTVESTSNNIEELENSALQQNEDYNAVIEETGDDVNNPLASTGMDNTYPIKPIFRDQAKEIKLPKFVQRVESLGLFGTETDYTEIEKSDLLEGIDLSKEDHKIDFTRSNSEVVQVDLVSDNGDNTDSVPVHKQLNMRQLEFLKQQLLSIPPEGKKHQLAGTIAKRLNITEVSEKMLAEYVFDCIKDMNNEEIDDLITFQLQTLETVKDKINSILADYRYKTFNEWLDLGKIKCVEESVYTMPKQMVLQKKLIGVQKCLYQDEEDVNSFESRVISNIANDDNVLFWHRNQERGKGFYINGFINHYPDFIVYLRTGQILLVEAKGDDRDNSDSEKKLELGKIWANKAGERYHYFMVFDKKAMAGAITIKELLGYISKFDRI